MRSSRLHAFSTAAALLFIAACKGGARTDTPVTTTAGGQSSTSPSGVAAAAQGKSMVRLVNAVPGQTVSVTGDEAPVFASVAYKTVTPYVEVKDNVIKFRLRAAGAAAGDQALAENTETLADGSRYTIVALPGDNGHASLHVMRDEVIPDAGKARIRVINAAPDLGDVDVAVGSTRNALFDKVGFGHEAGPKDVDPVSMAIAIRNAHNAPVRVHTMTLAAGRSYTIVLAGRTGSFEGITFDDAVQGLVPARQ
jgi:hypothetical protein